MRQQGRGATLRKHGARWICPVAEAEVTTGEDGRRRRSAGAKHAAVLVWGDAELVELATSCGSIPPSDKAIYQ